MEPKTYAEQLKRAIWAQPHEWVAREAGVSVERLREALRPGGAPLEEDQTRGACRFLGFDPEPMIAASRAERAALALPGELQALLDRIRPTQHAQAFCFTYTNWRSETAERVATLDADSVRYGTTEYHTSPTWLIEGVDVEKDAARTFDLAQIRDLAPDSLTVDSADVGEVL